jgi:ribonuclease M5
MLQIQQAIIVEGKYDKIKLASLVKAVIIPTHGFRIFKDAELLALIRHYAKTTGILILTDSDRAGFRIRSYLKGAIPDGSITNIYIPDVFGKEKRKEKPSAEGKLGVEGMDAEILCEAFRKAGVLTQEQPEGDPITKSDFYFAGLSGAPGSAESRRSLQKKLGLPSQLSASALLEVLNSIMTREDFLQMTDSRKEVG